MQQHTTPQINTTSMPHQRHINATSTPPPSFPSFFIQYSKFNTQHVALMWR
jgi:hypothetical protein